MVKLTEPLRPKIVENLTSLILSAANDGQSTKI